MKEGKYYDVSRSRLIGDADGCAYAEWGERFRACPFCIHPSGFPIFVPPSAIQASDEYAEGDPYTVDLAGSPFHQRRLECTLELLRLAIPGRPAARILDIGCGAGHITNFIQREFPSSEVTGLDYSVSAVEYAVTHFPGIDFVAADAYQPPFPPGYFDVVVCNNLWEHVPDPLHLLKVLRGILAPSGSVIISTPSRYRLTNLLAALQGKNLAKASHHVTEYSVGQIIEQLTYGKFQVLKCYSKPIKEQPRGIKGRLAYWVIGPVLRAYLRLIRSHHTLEGTVFFLARKTGE